MTRKRWLLLAMVGCAPAEVVPPEPLVWIGDAERRLPDPWREGPCMDVELADLDGDGDLDVVFGNEGADAVWLQEEGTFVAGPVLPLDGETRAVDLGDVDGDGILDLVTARVDWRVDDPQSRLYRGVGDGSFVWVEDGLPVEEHNSLDLDFVDLDDDGDLDLLGAHITDSGSGPWTFWRNVGGVFEDATVEVMPRQPTGAALDIDAADLDGDGIIDLYLCDRGGNDRVLFGGPADR